MNGILVSMVWQKSLMVNDRKSKSTKKVSSTAHGTNSQEPNYAHVKVQGYSARGANFQPHGAEDQATSYNDTGSHAESNAQAAELSEVQK